MTLSGKNRKMKSMEFFIKFNPSFPGHLSILPIEVLAIICLRNHRSHQQLTMSCVDRIDLIMKRKWQIHTTGRSQRKQHQFKEHQLLMISRLTLVQKIDTVMCGQNEKFMMHSHIVT